MKWLTLKSRAGALQFSILISVVIAVIVGAFILLTYTQLLFAKKVEFANSAIQLSQEGIQYAKAHETTYKDSLELTWDFKGFEEQVVLSKRHWGMFDKFISRGSSKNFRHTKIALMGGSLLSIDRPALYLEDSNTPLVVAGKTEIRGTAIVSRQGVKAGAIVGNYYQGKELIYGDIRKIATKKPSISADKRRYVNQLLFQGPPSNKEVFIQLQLENRHSFTEESKWVYSRDPIFVNNEMLANNIIVKSDSLIRVSAFAKAENILLIAPHILFEKGAHLSLQAFASKSITVEENVVLSYPSALVLQEKPNVPENKDNQGIFIESNALIEGSVVQLSAEIENIRKPKISIQKEATIYGEVYSDEWLELFGKVQGSVYAHQLASRVRGSIYKNHFFNASIQSTSLPEDYCGLITDKSNKNIVAWVF